MLCPPPHLTLYSTFLVFRIYHYHANWINSSQSTKSYWKRGLEVIPHQTDKKFFTYGNWETNVTCFKIISSLRLFHPIDLLSKQ